MMGVARGLLGEIAARPGGPEWIVAYRTSMSSKTHFSLELNAFAAGGPRGTTAA